MAPEDPDEPTAVAGGAQTRASLAAIETVIRFAAGDTIAGRYKILRMIAHGGMGDVYEATDLDLRTEIALKTIRGAANGARVERFRRELFLARKVTHPNVCRVFDLGRHSVQGVGDVAFITMELLRGETLADRLKTTGRMALGEALMVIRQIAAAIDAAHAAGVVHRDLKPANVMLVPGDGQPRLRAIVTDFGIAHASGDPFADVSLAGELIGSPAYMAPEQIEGGDTTPRTDLYSLGILIYELVTGIRPFSGESTMSAAVMRLTTGPARPSALLPELPPVWDAAIMRCLQVDPIARYASGAELVEALAGETSGLVRRVELDATAMTDAATRPVGAVAAPPSTAPTLVLPTGPLPPPASSPSPRPRARRRWLAGALVLAAAGGGALAVRAIQPAPVTPTAPAPATSAATAPAPDPASIAVLPFVDASPGKDQEYLADGLTEELMVRLAQVPGVRVVGRASALALRGSTDDAPTLGRKLGVARLLEGKVARSGERLRITARLVNTADGFQLWAETYDRDNRDVFAVQDDIAAAVTRALELRLGPAARTSTGFVPSPEAHDQLLLGRKLATQDTQAEFERGVRALRRATELEPRYAAAYAALALGEYGLRDYAATAEEGRAHVTRALELAEQALALGPDLAEVHSARAYLLLNIKWDWPAARAAFDRALELDPTNPVMIRRYADLLDLAGDLDGEERLLRRASALDPLAWQPWNALGLLALARGQLADARASLGRALDLDPGSMYSRAGLAAVDLLDHQPEAAIARAAPLEAAYRLTVVAMAEHSRGRAAASQAALDELIKTYGHTAAYQVASIHAWRGELDEAFTWLDTAIADHDAGMTSIRTDPMLANLRADPRYAALLTRLKLTP